MKLKWFLGLLGVIAALAVWGYFRLFPSDRTLLEKRTRAVAKAVSFEGSEGTVRRMLSAQSLGGYFTSNVVIRVNWGRSGRVESVGGRQDLVQGVMQMRARWRGLKLSVYDLEARVGESGESGEVDVTALAEVTGDSGSTVQRLRLNWEKIDGVWLIREVRTLEAGDESPAPD